MSGSGREVLPDVREWSGVSPGCPGVVGSLFWMSGSGRETLPEVESGWEALPDVRGLLGGHFGCPGVVGSPSRVVERPSQCLGVVGRAFRMYESGLEALLKVR